MLLTGKVTTAGVTCAECPGGGKAYSIPPAPGIDAFLEVDFPGGFPKSRHRGLQISPGLTKANSRFPEEFSVSLNQSSR